MSSFLTTLRTAYLQQGGPGRILIAGVSLLVLCCLCPAPILLLRARSSSNPVPGPIVSPGAGTQATPTPLFDFDFPTFTPFPTSTSFVPTAFPTLTPPPTGTQAPTQTDPAPTVTPAPSATATLEPPTSTATSVSAVRIVNVNTAEQYAEIQNLTGAPVNLRGWKLVSERGGESCGLRGTLEPNQVLRIWARRGDPGFDCRLGREIWSDDELDPAILYNPAGEEVSRYP